MPRYSTVVIVDDETRRHHQIKNLKIFKDKLIDFYDFYTPTGFLDDYRREIFESIDILFLDNDMGVTEDGVWLAKKLVEAYAYPIEQAIVHSMNVAAAGRIVDIINESSIGGAIRIPADELARHY